MIDEANNGGVRDCVSPQGSRNPVMGDLKVRRVSIQKPGQVKISTRLNHFRDEVQDDRQNLSVSETRSLNSLRNLQEERYKMKINRKSG